MNFLKLLLSEILEEKTWAPSPMPLNGTLSMTGGQPPGVSNFWSSVSFTINIPNMMIQLTPDHDFCSCALLLALPPFNLTFSQGPVCNSSPLLPFLHAFPAFHQPLTFSWRALQYIVLAYGTCGLAGFTPIQQ